MTIVLFQISLRKEKRVEHLTSFFTLDQQEQSLNIVMNKILPVQFSDVSPNLNNECLTSIWAAMWWILGQYSTQNPLTHHWIHHTLSSFHKLRSILSCSSKIRWIPDFDGTFQDNRIWRRRLSCAEDWWWFRHQLMTYISMNVLPTNRFQTWEFMLFCHQCRRSVVQFI